MICRLIWVKLVQFCSSYSLSYSTFICCPFVTSRSTVAGKPSYGGVMPWLKRMRKRKANGQNLGNSMLPSPIFPLWAFLERIFWYLREKRCDSTNFWRNVLSSHFEHKIVPLTRFSPQRSMYKGSKLERSHQKWDLIWLEIPIRWLFDLLINL